MTKPTAKDIIEEEEPWEFVTEELRGKAKWGTLERTIVRDPETGKLYALDYLQTRDEGREYDDEEVYEVTAVRKTIVSYERVRGSK